MESTRTARRDELLDLVEEMSEQDLAELVRYATFLARCGCRESEVAWRRRLDDLVRGRKPDPE